MAQYGVQPPIGVIDESSGLSGVSWGAIFAGAAGAAALSLVLLLLGTGLGMSSISPWSSQGASAATLGMATIVWLAFTQIAASGMGGYLAGRLRTKWTGVHTDEVYFRDTAHGFLAWAVATLLTASLLASVVGSIVGAGTQAGATVLGGAASTAASATAASASNAAGPQGGSDASTGPMSYFVDSLFRREPVASTPAATATPGAPSGDATTAPATPTVTPMPASGNPMATDAEATRIFLNGIRNGALPPEDARYVGQLVAQRTGLSQQDAQKRVNDTFAKTQAALKDAQAKAKEAVDTARKASAYASLWLVVSLLIGAFVASFAATWGGRRRDL
ncbi:hypothetical protein [uncultured Variovorax sp.]|uniref:hypothetical protein n=1 Tax=uncultured Variovorax sp. TaxID=114708 RepID=UPI0025EE23E6|nr:hypothetical protein [uncultured Variovorax sp.]